MKAFVLFAGLLSMSSVAMADQCQYVTKAQAEKAIKIVLETSKLQTLCEPCGERTPTALTVKSVGIEDVNTQSFWALTVNGEQLDLAYTYVNGMNLAKLAGCKATDVSLILNK